MPYTTPPAPPQETEARMTAEQVTAHEELLWHKLKLAEQARADAWKAYLRADELCTEAHDEWVREFSANTATRAYCAGKQEPVHA